MSNVTAFSRDARAIEAPGIEALPVHDLYLSEMNPRQEADPEGIALLADSIAMIGLIQPLAGLRDPQGKVGIVAGGRRWRAIRLALERDPELVALRPELAFVPVRLAPDEATARAWAAVENTAREDLHPADEIRAYGRMRDGGADVPTIARTFGVTEAHVYRRLALAALPCPVLDALKAGEIALGAAKAFTVADDEALSLSVLEQVRGREISEHRLKQLLQPEAINAAGDRRARFVGIDAYRAAGGRMTADLFADTALLQDGELLTRLFAEKLTAETAAAAQGWKWAETISEAWISYDTTARYGRVYPVEGELTEEQAERFDELAELAEAEVLDEDGQAELDALQAILDGGFTDEQKAHAGILAYVSNEGELRLHQGLVRPEDAAAAVEAGIMQENQHTTGSGVKDGKPKSPYSGALVEDMRAVRLHAVQAALLAKPELVLDLLAFGLSGESGVDRVFGIRPETGRNTPSVTDGLDADPRLADSERTDSGWLDDDERRAAFRAFIEKGKKHRNAAITAGIARTLPYPGHRDGFFAAIEDMAGADLRKVWTPTAENFLGRVSADYLEALMLDLTDTDPQGSGFKAFKAQKKAAKALSLEKLFSDPDYQAAWQIDAEKKARIDAWLPDCF